MCGTLYLGGHFEAHDFARDDAEAFVLAVFVAAVEEQLQAEADAEKRFAVGDGRANRLDELALAERGDGVAKCADAWQHDLFGDLRARPDRW